MKAAQPLLIRGAEAVLTGCAPGQGNERSAASDIRIGADGTLREMGRGLAAHEGERVLDASGCVVYPGWVNTHHHLFQSLLKGVAAGIDATLTPWLAAVPYAWRSAFDEPLLRLAARIGLVELLRSGCTTVGDHHYLHFAGQDFDSDRILIEEADRLGLRFMLMRGGATRLRPVESERDPARPETLEQYVAGVERAAARWHRSGPRARTRVAMAPTTINVSVDPGELRALARAGRALGLPLHSHLSETVATHEQCRAVHGMEPVQFAAEHEWVGPDVWFAHLVHVSESERALLGQTRTGIAHCPQSNGRLGSGIAAAPAMARAGMRVSLGVDGAASNEAADMLSELHFAWLAHRAQAGSRARPRPEGTGEEGADAVSVEQLVHWASAGGAQVLGFEGVGTLEVGQAADLSVWALDDPRHFGLHDPALAPIVSGARPRLRWLLCDGHVRVEDDAIPGLDLAELGAQARAAVARLRAH